MDTRCDRGRRSRFVSITNGRIGNSVQDLVEPDGRRSELSQNVGDEQKRVLVRRQRRAFLSRGSWRRGTPGRRRRRRRRQETPERRQEGGKGFLATNRRLANRILLKAETPDCFSSELTRTEIVDGQILKRKGVRVFKRRRRIVWGGRREVRPDMKAF